MKSKIDFPQDEQISQWQSDAKKLSPDCNIEEFFYPHYSAYALRRLARTQKRLYQSMALCVKAAARQEYLAAERCKQEALRIEKLIRDVSKDASLSKDDHGDGSSVRDWVITYCVNIFALVDIDDESLRRIFRNGDLYFYLFDHRADEQDKKFWAGMVERFGGRRA